jgi:hypothetical protein
MHIWPITNREAARTLGPASHLGSDDPAPIAAILSKTGPTHLDVARIWHSRLRTRSSALDKFPHD